MEYAALPDSETFPREHVVSHILEPLATDAFINEYWAKRPLHIRGHEHKFTGLFSLERFVACLDAMRAWSSDGSHAAAGSSVHQRAPAPMVRASFDHGRTSIKIEPAYAMTFYRAGATLCVDGLASVDALLANVARAVRQELSFVGPLDFRGYLSADGQGFDLHFDARVATTLQIEGSKTWTFSNELALEWPAYQVMTSEDGSLVPDRELQDWEKRYRRPEHCTFEQVTLQPGDVLCLPAGAWHSAQAIGKSLAVNMAFGHSGGVWRVLNAVLTRRLGREGKWREPLPLVSADRTNDGEVPDSVRQFFDSRVHELIAMLGKLATDPHAINTLWHHAVAGNLGLKIAEKAADHLESGENRRTD